MSGGAARLVRSLLTVLALAAPVQSARAQSVLDGELRLAPQYVQYRLQSPADERITELVVPLYLTVPIGSRFSVDVGTAYASARVTSGGVRSEISGPTDTQIRGNLTLGGDFLVLTAGVNLPTGDASVTLDELSAAGRIGNDFLDFPISNMGTGLAATGGVAVARALGAWNVGVGAAMRRSAAYEPFELPDQRFRYRPGNEVRARLGVDRELGSGRVALGLTYSAFGRDDLSGSAYNTGDRVIVQGALTGLAGASEYTLVAYNIFRGPGEYASGDRAGRENIANLFASLGLGAFGTLVEPSIELRHWRQTVHAPNGAADEGLARSQSSVLGTMAVRTRVDVGGVSVYPGVGYSRGRLAILDQEGAPARAALDGFRFQVAMQVGQ